MEISPYEDDDFGQASEFLRLTLALLGRHRVPPSPCNFRIGYEQVSGRNADLEKDFVKLADELDGYDHKALWKLYQAHFMQDEGALSKMREELKSIIRNVRNEFQTAGGTLESYSDTLSHFADILDQPTSTEQMSVEVRKVIDNTESVQRSQAQMQVNMQHMMSEIDSLRQELNQVKQESLTDALTGIANRKAFDNALENAIANASESDTPFCLVLLDIDHFKKFNDTHGHLVGDKVIRFVAATLKRQFKGQDLCARYGGEEFAVILPGTPLDGARVVADQVRGAISAKALKDSSSNSDYGHITISAGVAEHTAGEQAFDLIGRSDTALYEAKKLGRNRVEISEPSPFANLNAS